jgi:hypothetical protein
MARLSAETYAKSRLLAFLNRRRGDFRRASLVVETHRCSAGRAGYTSYTLLGQFACQASTAHTFGQNCSCQLMGGTGRN